MPYLAGGGEMGERLRQFDWTTTPLGPPLKWPQPLKTLVALMLASKQPMFVAWGDSRTLLYNDDYAPMLANRHPQALGRKFFEVWPEVEAELTPLFNQVFAGEPVHMDDLTLQLKREGLPDEAHFAFSYTPVRTENGEVVGLFCPCTETTEAVLLQRHLEQRVEAQTRERDRAWRNSQDLLVVIDGEGRFLEVNPAVTTILGWEPEDWLGRLLFEFLHPDDAAQTGGALEHASHDALPVYENRYRHKDGGHRWLSWVASPENGLIYATARHVTAEKAQALALAEAQDDLRQAQKMEAVGQLTGGIAHDFNNLLTGVTGSLELIRSRMAQGRFDAVERYVYAAEGAAKRAAALTQRLLAFSRRQTLDPKAVDVNRLVSGMEEILRRTVGPSIFIEVVGAGGLWPTLVDAGQLDNALLNLCINARDAMPDGGRLTIETANKWLDERSAAERDLPPGQYVTLCVTDTGTGMTPEVIARAFDPFFTTKPIGSGTGLGLSMIYGFVRQSGGQVRIYSEIGQGTTMCLYLPRFAGEAEDEASELAVSAPDEAKDGETVLIVDDEPTVRMLVAEILEDAGYIAIEAGDGAAALKVLEREARIDLLVTDVGLPGGMNGRQVADAARVLRPDLKVLFITGYAENAAVGNGHLERGMEVVTKPFSMDTLASKIRDMIAN